MKKPLLLKVLLLIVDILLINISLIIATVVKFNSGVKYYFEKYPELFLLINITWLILFFVLKSYDIRTYDRASKWFIRIFSIISFHLLVIASFWVFTKSYHYSREFLFLTYLSITILIFSWRVLYYYLLKYLYKLTVPKNIIVYGYGPIATELVAFLRLHAEYGYKFLGYFDNNRQSEQIKGTYSELQDFVRNNEVDEIYCCLPYVDYSHIKELIDFGDESLVRIKLLTDFRGFASKNIELHRYEHIPVLSVNSTPLDDWKNRAVKRVFDITFSLFVLIFIFSWLYPIIALLIKIDSKGPILFKQKRTGLNNDDFYCYKFRTMKVNSESDVKQATKDDSRITKLGRFLRKSSLDELPQFLNVLMGSMSVIGPRPHMLSHTEEYAKKVEKFMARHFVKPGITGLAQAKGYRGETKHIRQMQNRVKLDRFYVDNWSLWLDIKIIFMTITSIIKGNENAF